MSRHELERHPAVPESHTQPTPEQIPSLDELNRIYINLDWLLSVILFLSKVSQKQWHH
jgi:hypothetical protein